MFYLLSILPYVTVRVNMENIVPREISHSEKTKYQKVFTHMSNLMNKIN